MTPRETFMAIDAAVWREEQQQKREIALAWRTAMLSRAKRIPSLKMLLATKPAKPLEGEELARRRREHAEMTRNVDVNVLGAQLAKAQHGIR